MRIDHVIRSHAEEKRAFLNGERAGQAALSDIEENPFLFEELLGRGRSAVGFFPCTGKNATGKNACLSASLFPSPCPSFPGASRSAGSSPSRRWTCALLLKKATRRCIIAVVVKKHRPNIGGI